MRLFLLIYIVAHANFADASKADYAQRLLKAKSAGEVQLLQRTHDEHQVAHRACKLQLMERAAPLACYESLNLEIKWGQHPNPKQQRNLREKLDRLCADASLRLQIPRKFPRSISTACRISLTNAHRVRIYRESPAEWSEN